MQSIPAVSPLMSAFSAPLDAEKDALPLMPQGLGANEPEAFSSIFTALLPATDPALEPVGLSPLLSGYGNGLPLNEAETNLIEVNLAELDTVLDAPELNASPQSGTEDMALLLAQFGYVITSEKPVAVTEEGEVIEVSAVDAEEEESPLLGLTQSEIDALTAEQAMLAGQQQTERVTSPVTIVDGEQKLTRQAAAEISVNQAGKAVADDIKTATVSLTDDLSEEMTDDGFLKTNLAGKDTQPNTPTTPSTPLNVTSVVDNMTNTPQPVQANMVGLQASQTNQINSLAQATQVAAPEGFASAALSKEVLEMTQDTRQWGNALSQRIVTMITDDVQQARIQLDPPELGSLQVRIHIQNDQATIHVQAQHTHVRDALESNAFRLRDALANDGIQLEDFDVSSGEQQSQEQLYGQAEGQEQKQGTGEAGLITDAESGEWLVTEDNVGQTKGRMSSVNLLDTFA